MLQKEECGISCFFTFLWGEGGGGRWGEHHFCIRDNVTEEAEYLELLVDEF